MNHKRYIFDKKFKFNNIALKTRRNYSLYNIILLHYFSICKEKFIFETTV